MNIASKVLTGLLVLGTVGGAPHAFADPASGGKPGSEMRSEAPAQKRKALPSMKASELMAKLNGQGKNAVEELRKGVKLTNLSELAGSPIEAAVVVLKALSGKLGGVQGITLRFRKEHLLVRIARAAGQSSSASPAPPTAEPPADEDDEE